MSETTESKSSKKSRKAMPSPEEVEQVSNVFDLQIEDAICTVKKGIKIGKIAESDDSKVFISIEFTADLDLSSAEKAKLPAREAVGHLAKEAARITEGKHDMKLTLRRDYGTMDVFFYDQVRDSNVEIRADVKGDPKLSFAEGKTTMRLKMTADVPADKLAELAWYMERTSLVNISPLQQELI